MSSHTKPTASKKTSEEVALKRKRPVVTLAKDADVVLKRVRKLRENLVRNSQIESNETERNSRPSASVPPDILEVSDLPNGHVIEAMEILAMRIATQVLQKQGLTLEVPSRASSNQIYVKEWDRIVLGGKKSARNFLNVRESRKAAITVRVMQLLHAGTFEEPVGRTTATSVARSTASNR
jgi:meiotic recombination protein SPO11